MPLLINDVEILSDANLNMIHRVACENMKIDRGFVYVENNQKHEFCSKVGWFFLNESLPFKIPGQNDTEIKSSIADSLDSENHMITIVVNDGKQIHFLKRKINDFITDGTSEDL